MNKASIDIGSNSILLLIAEIKNGQIFPILEKSNVTGLGKGIDKTKEFTEESMESSFSVLKEYASDVIEKNIPIEEVIITATEASRVAKNAQEFYAKVLKETGLKVQIISGEQEAFYSAKGVVSSSVSIDGSVQFLMDIGGASTEFIKCSIEPYKLIESISLPIGVVRLTEKLGKYQNLSLNELKKRAFDIIQTSTKDFSYSQFSAKSLIGIAGTMTSMVMMQQNLKVFSEEKINSFSLNKEHLNTLLEKVYSLTPDQIKENYPILGKRSGTIVAGILISLFFSNELNCDSYLVSTRGLRYGTITGINPAQN